MLLAASARRARRLRLPLLAQLVDALHEDRGFLTVFLRLDGLQQLDRVREVVRDGSGRGLEINLAQHRERLGRTGGVVRSLLQGAERYESKVGLRHVTLLDDGGAGAAGQRA